MKRGIITIAFMALVGIVGTGASHAGMEELFKSLKDAVGVGSGLSEDKIVAGLKEALKLGSENAVKSVSRAGGYYENPTVKILLPDSVRKTEKYIRAAGLGPHLDEFEKSMNQAAEQAAPQAKPIFWDAIKQINFGDAKKILDGRENEATLYFQEKTEGSLHQIFKPIVHETMSKAGVTRKYQELDAQVRSIPFVGGFRFDLDDYVTKGALKGLFAMLAEEEKKIRQNPAARVTEILKEVFGKR
jgi:hypothetical protein